MRILFLFVLVAVVAGDIRGEMGGEDRPTALRKPLVVDITGAEYEWHMRYPGSDGKLNTGDDGLDKRHLHLPAHTEVKLQLHSEDYLYSFALPHLDLKEIAIPDLEFSLSFTTGPEGTFDLLGDQLCGYAHPKLMGKLIILSPSDFAERMNHLSNPPSHGLKRDLTTDHLAQQSRNPAKRENGSVPAGREMKGNEWRL